MRSSWCVWSGLSCRLYPPYLLCRLRSTSTPTRSSLCGATPAPCSPSCAAPPRSATLRCGGIFLDRDWVTLAALSWPAHLGQMQKPIDEVHECMWFARALPSTCWLMPMAPKSASSPSWSAQVVVTEGAPTYQGQQMARELAAAGIRATLIADSAVFAMMARVNKVCSARLNGMSGAGIPCVAWASVSGAMVLASTCVGCTVACTVAAPQCGGPGRAEPHPRKPRPSLSSLMHATPPPAGGGHGAGAAREWRRYGACGHAHRGHGSQVREGAWLAGC